MEGTTRSNTEPSRELLELRSNLSELISNFSEGGTTQHIIENDSSPKGIELKEDAGGPDSGKFFIMLMGL